MKAHVLALLATSLLAGCGFHLVGTRPIPAPLQTVSIDSSQKYQSSEPPVETALRALLQRRGATVLGNAEDAPVVIKLWNANEARQVLSIGADSKALEYQLTSQVSYSVSGKGKQLVPPDTISLTRSYTYNPQAALAEEIKEEHLREYLQSELAELLMLRLEAALGPKADAPAAPSGATPPS